MGASTSPRQEDGEVRHPPISAASRERSQRSTFASGSGAGCSHPDIATTSGANIGGDAERAEGGLRGEQRQEAKNVSGLCDGSEEPSFSPPISGVGIESRGE